MLLSIIISNHRRNSETKRLVDDIIKYNKRSCNLFEIIVVDYDNPEIFDLQARVISTTRYPYQDKEGLGLCHMRNIGAKVAYGEWLMFLDADIYPGEFTVQEVINTVSAGDRNCVYGGLRVKLNNAGSPILTDPPNPHMPNIPLYGFCMIFHKDNFWKLNGYNEGIRGWGGDDLDIMDRAFKLGMTSKVIMPAIWYHPIHPDASWRIVEKEPFPITEGYHVEQVTEFELDRTKYVETNRALQAQVDAQREAIQNFNDLNGKYIALQADIEPLKEQLKNSLDANNRKDIEIAEKINHLTEQADELNALKQQVAILQADTDRVREREAELLNTINNLNDTVETQDNTILELEAQLAGFQDAVREYHDAIDNVADAQVSEPTADKPIETKKSWWQKLFG